MNNLNFDIESFPNREDFTREKMTNLIFESEIGSLFMGMLDAIRRGKESAMFAVACSEELKNFFESKGYKVEIPEDQHLFVSRKDYNDNLRAIIISW